MYLIHTDGSWVCTGMYNCMRVCSSAVEKEIEERMGGYAVFMGLGVDSSGDAW